MFFIGGNGRHEKLLGLLMKSQPKLKNNISFLFVTLNYFFVNKALQINMTCNTAFCEKVSTYDVRLDDSSLSSDQDTN